MKISGVFFGQDNPAGVLHLFFGKETRTPVGHADQVRISDMPFEPEKEEPGFSLTGKMIDLDLVSNHIARHWKPPVKFDLCIQKPVTPLSFHHMIDTQV
jgi:hypothetical protein